MIYGMGMLDMGIVFSPSQMVIDHEIARMIRRTVQGIAFDDERIGLDTIHAVGIGGNYLDTAHTVHHMGAEQVQAWLMERRNRDEWERSGSRTLVQVAAQKAREIVNTHVPLPLADGMHEALMDVVKSAE